MSTSATPPPRLPDEPGRPDEPARATRRPATTRVRPDADFELMLALRGAARARDLRNRVVRPRSAETRDAAGPGPEDDAPPDRPRDLAHPN